MARSTWSLRMKDAGARDQRLEAICFRRLLIVDQRTACADDLVVVLGRDRGQARRGIGRRHRAGIGAGGKRTDRARPASTDKPAQRATELSSRPSSPYPSNIDSACGRVARSHVAVNMPADFDDRLPPHCAASLTQRIFGLITFEWIIGLLLAAVVLSALARRLACPTPPFLPSAARCLPSCPPLRPGRSIPNWHWRFSSHPC